jgi:hypothetical protein
VITTTMRLGKWGILLLSLVWPLHSFAGVDGKYQGEFRGQKVTAVLETMSTTVTGVLGIGAESYLLRAEAGKGAIPGQLNNIKSGDTLKLLIKPKGDAIDVEVTPTGANMMRFTLKRIE